MTAKSVLVRPQGLRPRARAPTCPPCYATELKTKIDEGQLPRHQEVDVVLKHRKAHFEEMGTAVADKFYCISMLYYVFVYYVLYAWHLVLVHLFDKVTTTTKQRTLLIFE